MDQTLINRIESRDAVVGVVGLGYVGLPLVLEFAHAGFPVVGFDIDQRKVDSLNEGNSGTRRLRDRAPCAGNNRLCPHLRV